jgi:uncharacterized membrane protein
VADEPSAPRDNDPQEPKDRRIWLWFGIGSVAAVAVLSICSQIAKDHRQAVDWYTGFGQWLGALATFIAAVVALVIATTDRRRADDQRHAEQADRERDLSREAGLVRVDPSSEPSFHVVARNHRLTKICEITVHLDRSDQPSPVRTFDTSNYTGGPDREAKYLPAIAVEAGETIAFKMDGTQNPTHVALRYTDSTGRRWEVDHQRKVRKVTD